MPRPERIFRTEAIILRRYEFGEADRLLTLFTADHGKLRVLAKGARRMNSRQLGHVELFTRSKMLIARGRDLHVVSQAEMVEPFLPLQESLQRGAYANYVVELLDHFSEFEEQNEAMFDLLNATLLRLCAPDADIQLVTRFYELHILRLAGFQPALFSCAIGQEELEPREQFFGVVEGGVICPDHVGLARSVTTLSLNALKTLRHMQRQPYDVISRLKLTYEQHNELERVLQNYIVHILEQRLKSIEFIRRLRRME